MASLQAFPSSLLPRAWSRALIPFPFPFERLPRRLSYCHLRNKQKVHVVLSKNQLKGITKRKFKWEERFLFKMPLTKEKNSWHPISFLLFTFLFTCKVLFSEEGSRHFGKTFTINCKVFYGVMCTSQPVDKYSCIPNFNFNNMSLSKAFKKGTHRILIG